MSRPSEQTPPPASSEPSRRSGLSRFLAKYGISQVPRLTVATARGRSMEPTLHEGDRLLVVRGLAPRAGHLALVRLPDGPQGPRPPAVKRISGSSPRVDGGWWLDRDNPKAGLDSWELGPVQDDAVLGRVLMRLPDVRLPRAVRDRLDALGDRRGGATRKRR